MLARLPSTSGDVYGVPAMAKATGRSPDQIYVGVRNHGAAKPPRRDTPELVDGVYWDDTNWLFCERMEEIYAAVRA